MNVDQAKAAAQDKFGQTASDVSNAASEYAGRAGETMRDTAETVRREAGNAGERAYAAGARATEYVEGTVREQPLLTLIGAAAIGYAISFLFHSPSSPFAPNPPKRGFFQR
jgi:ElaB/YqjD/DUF883 family membrane-anchored ribosome-binding protein